MSDSILYLAIVGIWAGFLIPAWVRRPHTSKSELEVDAEAEEFGAGTGPPAEVTAESAPAGSEADGGLQAIEPAPRRAAPRPSSSRARMMRARRRILTILTSLVFITGAFVATGLVQWWICVPPIGMLVLYVLLLREIVTAEAELASKRAAFQARAARDVWRRAHQAWEAERRAAAEPTAEIIDISSRVGDQLYDQYADAAIRAVGD